MKNFNIKKESDSRYKIQGSHIIDNHQEIKNGNPIYIREILDSASSEYKSSTISKKDRLDIIGNIGLDLLIPILDECFKNKEGCNYNAENEVAFVLMDILKGEFPKLDFCLVENNSKLELVLQIAPPGCKYKGISFPHPHQLG